MNHNTHMKMQSDGICIHCEKPVEPNKHHPDLPPERACNSCEGPWDSLMWGKLLKCSICGQHPTMGNMVIQCRDCYREMWGQCTTCGAPRMGDRCIDSHEHKVE